MGALFSLYLSLSPRWHWSRDTMMMSLCISHTDVECIKYGRISILSRVRCTQTHFMELIWSEQAWLQWEISGCVCSRTGCHNRRYCMPLWPSSQDIQNTHTHTHNIDLISSNINPHNVIPYFPAFDRVSLWNVSGICFFFLSPPFWKRQWNTRSCIY